MLVDQGALYVLSRHNILRIGGGESGGSRGEGIWVVEEEDGCGRNLHDG